MNEPRPETFDSPTHVPTSGMAAEHALLGLLAMRDDGSGHGYELARCFDPGAPLGNVIRLEPGMVYHHLKKIERLGWVAELPDPAPDRPARRPFVLSPAGREELRRWLTEPVTHTREIRLEFLVKLYLALALDPELAIRLIDEQREICARLIESLSAHAGDGEKRADAPAIGVRFGELVREMRLAQTKAALAWLDRVKFEEAAPADVDEPDGESAP